MYLYEIYYFTKDFKKVTLATYGDNIQQIARLVIKQFNLSDYDLKLSEQKRKEEFTSDYTLYKHTTKQTFFINQIG